MTAPEINLRKGAKSMLMNAGCAWTPGLTAWSGLCLLTTKVDHNKTDAGRSRRTRYGRVFC